MSFHILLMGVAQSVRIEQGYRVYALLCFGLGAVIIGSYLPWLRVNPRAGPSVPSILLPGMRMGFEAIHIAIALPAILTVLVIALDVTNRVFALAAFVTGIVAILLPMLTLGLSISRFGTTFHPALGWVVTVFGGVIMTIVAISSLLGAR